MDYRFGPEELELQARVRKFANEKLAPLADEADESDSLTPAVTKALAESGLFKYVIPKAYGGADIKVTNICIIREEMGKVCAQADATFAMQGLGSYAISLAGTEEQKRKYLPKVASGEYLATFALTEPEAGSDPAALKTSAVRQGDHYILNGHKKFISQGGEADIYLVFCKTDPAAGSKGTSCFVIEEGTPGFDTSTKLRTLGPHCLGAPKFINCKVPAANMVGKPGDGVKLALSTLDVFRTTVAAFSLAMAEAAYSEAVRYAKGRSVFGQPLVEFQATQFKLAEMATQIEAARHLTYYSAWLKDQGERVTVPASMAKLFTTEMAQKVVDEALQIHGGNGLLRGSKIERLYKDVRMPRIYEGASEVLKLIISRGILKD